MIHITTHLALSELCQNIGIDRQVVFEMVEYEIAKPAVDEQLSEWHFDIESTYWIKKAVTINQELQIDWVATAMIIKLLKNKQKLEQENSQLKTQLERFI